jgi:hypothetical protein
MVHKDRKKRNLHMSIDQRVVPEGGLGERQGCWKSVLSAQTLITSALSTIFSSV